MWNACTRLLAGGLLALLAGCAGLSGGPSESGPAEARFKQALQEMQAQRYQAAAALLEALADEQPDAAGVQFNLGVSYHRLERYDDAEAALQAALEADPGFTEAHNMLAIVHRYQGRFETARERYQQLLALTPDHGNGHLNLAILCDIYLQDLECARAHYEQFQALSTEEDEEVAIWLADLERREAGGNP